VLNAKVPVTVADPEPLAVQITVHVPVDCRGNAFKGLYAPKAIAVALIEQEKVTAARALTLMMSAKAAVRTNRDRPGTTLDPDTRHERFPTAANEKKPVLT
jgi:hypothetical protein